MKVRKVNTKRELILGFADLSRFQIFLSALNKKNSQAFLNSDTHIKESIAKNVIIKSQKILRCSLKNQKQVWKKIFSFFIFICVLLYTELDKEVTFVTKVFKTLSLYKFMQETWFFCPLPSLVPFFWEILPLFKKLYIVIFLWHPSGVLCPVSLYLFLLITPTPLSSNTDDINKN